MCIKKVSLLASSNDAASNSDTIIFITLEMVHDIFRMEILGIKKVLLPALSDDAASDSDT